MYRRRVGRDATPIQDLLSVYKKRLRAPQKSVVRAFQEVLEKELDMRVEESCINYKPQTRTLSLSVPGPQKSEILIQKQHLLAVCSKQLGPQSAPKQII